MKIKNADMVLTPLEESRGNMGLIQLAGPIQILGICFEDVFW